MYEEKRIKKYIGVGCYDGHSVFWNALESRKILQEIREIENAYLGNFYEEAE